MFRATIENMHPVTLCTNTGSDENICDGCLLIELKTKGGQMKVALLKRPKLFHFAASLRNGQQATLECTKKVQLDVQLCVTHSSELMIRGVTWLVTRQYIGDPILGRPLLE